MSDDNKYEVSDEEVERPSNDTRLGGTCNPEPIRSAGQYEFAKPTSLDAADTGGPVGKPTMGTDFGMEGAQAPSLNPNVDVHNSDTTLMATASEENLSRKYKYPNVKQDIGPKGRPGVQFEDHT